MEDSNYLQEAYLSFGTEYCRIYIQPNFAIILQHKKMQTAGKDHK